MKPRTTNRSPHRSLQTRNQLQAHEELLLACTAKNILPECGGRLDAALANPDINWTKVLVSAVQHGVAGQVHDASRAMDNAHRIPLSALATLERIVAAQHRRNLAMYAALNTLSGALENAGVSALTLKGPVLAIQAYPNHAGRVFADIDIVVPPVEWEKAGAVAESVGFVPTYLTPTPQDYHRPYYTEADRDILTDTLVPEFEPRHRPDAPGMQPKRIEVEIHRSIFNYPNGYSRNLDMTAFWENSRLVDLPEAGSIHVPSPEAMLVHVAVHALHHNYWRLLFAADIAHAVRAWGPALDVDRLQRLVRQYDEFGALRRLLLFVEREFGCGPDAESGAGLDTGLDKVFPATELARRLPRVVGGPDDSPLQAHDVFHAMKVGLAAPSHATLEQLKRERSAAHAIRAAASIVFPAPSIMRRYYGFQSKSALACCYLVRPVQLLGRHAMVLYHRRRQSTGRE